MLMSIVYKPEGLEADDGYARVPLETAQLIEGYGIEGDSKGGKSKRQLNIISSGAVRTLAERGFRTRPGQLGEQLIVGGIDVEGLPVGTTVQIGNTARVELIELRTGCSRFEKFQGRNREEASGHLGMMSRVLCGGAIKVGDSVRVMPGIRIERHRRSWSRTFERLRNAMWASLADVALRVEHVGSTSVPGLAAKPVIDMDIVIENVARLPDVIDRLRTLGYTHLGDLGIPGRDAFTAPRGSVAHHLYVCAEGSDALQNHVRLRDRLRDDPKCRRRYAALKRRLAARFAGDIDAYCAGKTAFIVEILADEGMQEDQLAGIRSANTRI